MTFRILTLLFWLALSAGVFAQTRIPLWGDLNTGPHKVGFRVIKERDNNGKLFLVSIWYPAAKEGTRMTLKDYVVTGLWNGKEDEEGLSNGFKETLEHPLLFGIKKLSAPEYENTLKAAVAATANTEMERGKWPLIIIDTEPVSLCVTNEWLASNGFLVAVPSGDYPPPGNDSVLYKGPTEALGFMLSYLKQQPFVDTAQISALGFGGGSMAAFYLAMKDQSIKKLVNVEGGLFMPLSKTTLYSAYKPKQFTIPILHIVRPEIISGENINEVNAIASQQKYRVTLLSPVQHHDLTIYGRVVNGVLGKRGGESSMATNVFTKVHEFVLRFLKQPAMDESSVGPVDMFRFDLL